MNADPSPAPAQTYRPAGKSGRTMKRLITPVVLLALIAGGWYGYTEWQSSRQAPVHFKTDLVEKQDFHLTIEATGTLEPEEKIDVGAQVSGKIMEFGKDVNGKTVDYSSVVKEGQLLARIDDVPTKIDVKKAQAAVEQAKANVSLAKAELEDAKVKHELADRERKRAEKLGPSEALSGSAYDTYITNEKSARATLKIREASLEQANANLMAAEASLEKENRNLEYPTIVSPVDGVIIDRVVDIGQTVNAGMNTPSLFIIAKDLKKLKIWAAVNEADIALVKAGQDVIYTVDAFPNREFRGTVEKVRLNATMSSNVVTYIVEINAPNPDEDLLPYMTTTTQFIVKNWKDALVVPNTALRWTPSPELVVPGTTPPQGERVWIREGNLVKPVSVTVEETNGTLSVVHGEGLRDGLEIVTGIDKAPDQAMASGPQEATNPFMPKMPKRKKAKSGNNNPPPPH